jgi:hypothetical protein
MLARQKRDYLGADLSKGRRIQQQPRRLAVSPLGSDLARALAEQLGVVVGQPREENDGTPAFLAPRSASVP